MKNGFWKRFLALVMAIVIVASTGVLDSAGWLLANSGETEPTQPATQETTAPAGNQQGSTETTTMTVPPTSETTAPTGETSAPTGETTAPTGETSAPTGETTAPTGETTAPTGESSEPTGESSEPTGESTETTETTTPEEVLLAVVLQAAYTDGTAGYVIDSAVLTYGAGVDALTYEYAIPQVEGYTFSVPEMTLNAEGKYEITLGRPAESTTKYITVTYAPVSTEPTEPSEGDATEPSEPTEPTEPTEGETAEGITVTVNANQIFIGGTQEEATITLGSVTFGEEDTELTFSFSIPAVADHEAMVDSEDFISTDGLTYSGTIARPEESTSITVDIYYRAVEGAQDQDLVPVVPTDHYTFILDGNTVAEQIVKGEETVNAPASPEKDGHKFLGWNTAADGSGSYFTSTPAPSGATFTYYAVFEEVYYVFFMNDAGAVCATKEGVSGDVIAADITFPVDSDQSITGWYTDSAFTPANKVSSVTLTNANITLWAKVETGHWITYDSVGGTYIAPVFVHADANTAAPAAPEKLGYKFEGWFADGATEAYEFGGTLSNNIALTAKWTANTNTKYTIIHWQENANDNEYSFFASEEKSGTTGGQTAATAKSYTGFTVVTTGDRAWSQQTIEGDGSTIVNIYYSRNVYTIKFWPTGGGTTTGTLICTQEAHTHTNRTGSCYSKTCDHRNSRNCTNNCYTLVCTKNVHTHNDANGCYDYTNASDGSLFTITAKYGAYIRDEWPLNNGSARWSTVSSGGGPWQNSIDNMPLNGGNFYVPSDNSTHLRVVEYYVSCLPGEAADVTRGGVGYKLHHEDRSYGSSSSNVSKEDRYEIAGFTLNNTHSSEIGDNYSNSQFFYDRKSYTITFYNGNEIDSTATRLFEQSIADVGYTPDRPANVPEGYIFAGWYANKLMAGDPYVFAGKTMPAQALIFYAKWVPPTVSGTIYLTMKGDGAPQTIELKYGEKIDPSILPAYTVPDGYTDRGWALKEGDNYLPFNFDTVIYENITLYPYYTTSATVQVFYNANGGTGTVSDSRNYADGSFADVKSASGLTNGDKVFLYWSTVADGSGDKYLPGDKIPMRNENVTLYAIWGDVTEKAQLVYHNNDGTNKTDVHDNLLNNQLVVLKAGWTREGYEFLGWSTNPGATSEEYRAGDNYLVTNDNGVNNLYAVWKPTVFTVSYEYTGTVPTGAPEAPTSYKLTYGDPGTVAADPTLDGYTFSGWETSNTTVTDGSFTMPATNVTFTGSWTVRSDLEYTVNYYLIGTTTKVRTSKVVDGQTFNTTITETAPSINGYANVEPLSATITIGESGNVINFYYREVVHVYPDNVSVYYGETLPAFTARAVDAQGNVVSGIVYQLTKIGDGMDAGTYKIDSTGAEFQGTYVVSFDEGLLTINPRPITFTSATDSKVYDGKALTNDTVTPGGMGLAYSDTVTFNVTGSQTNVGSSKNTFTYTLANEGNYTVTKTEGTLTVSTETTPVTVTITENNGTFKYDGKSHEVTGYTVSISGSTVYSEADFEFKGDATVTGVNAGSYDMQLKASDFVNTNTNFSNVTFRIVDGKLNITKRAISFTSATDAKEYDGTPLTNDEVTVGGDGFAEGEGAAFNVTGTQTVAGSSANSFEVIANAGTDLENNYTVTKTEGTLTVKDRETKYVINVYANSDEFDYDGKEHTVTGFQTLTFTENGQTYTVSGISASGARTNAGTGVVATSGTPVVKDAAGNDVTGQFTVNVIAGTITVNKLQVTLTSPTARRVYNGEALTEPNATQTGFAAGEGVTITVTGSQTAVGSSDNTFTYTANEGTNLDNYIIQENVGTLTVDPVSEKITVTIQGNIDSKPYNGADQTVTGYKVVSISNSLYTEADFTFSGTASATRKDVGTNNMGLTAANFTNTNTATFTNVEFVVTDGSMTVTPIDVTVTITGHNSSVDYDGQAHGVTGYDVEISNPLYKEADITFTGAASASRTDAGKTTMGLTAGQFGNNNSNFGTVTFTVVDGYQEIKPIAVTVNVTGQQVTKQYDGTEYVAAGYTAEASNPLFDVEKDIVFSGTAEAKRTNVGTTNMGLTASMFGTENPNFSTVTFNVTDGFVTITPVDAVVITITGHTLTENYDGQPHTVTGFDISSSNPLYDTANVTFSGTATAERTDAGTTNMGLTAEMFGNSDGNFTNVTFVIAQDGSVTVNPINVTVTITGRTNTVPYDGKEHSVAGYTVEISNDLYTEADFEFKGTAAAARTDAGKTMMNLAAGQFENKNGNFATVTFNVTDGYQEITPIDVTVTIVGHNNTTAYDGNKHSVSGYDVSFSTDLYKEADFTFSGTAAAERTDAGKTMMNLAANQFANTNGNFANVTFNVTDGYQEITPIDVTVTITGHTSTVPYDGEEHTVTGYDVEISNPLFKETDIVFSGTASATRTVVGTTKMGLVPDQFSTENENFATVTFNVTDGYQTVVPISVTVTITGHNSTVDYDGEKHSVSGYDVSISNPLYTEADFTFTGTASAERTNAGTTNMGLAPDQFVNGNDNFTNVVFQVTDGYQTIKPIDVTVTITGHNSTVDYDGQAHSVSGYDVSISNPLYKESDFTFTGTASAERTNAGTTYMGLAADQFVNGNDNFGNVTFNVTDGYQTVTPIDVTVTITGHNSSVDYDGDEHTVTGYDVSISNSLYTEADFTFSGKAEAKRTNAGKTIMGLAAGQFANTNDNFETVTFVVTDGYQEIKPINVTVTITGHNNTTDYDGEEHTVTGYDVEISNPLYKESDFTFTGTASASRTDAGKTMMGLAADQFGNNNENFATVTFNVTDGYQEITPIDVTVTIVGSNLTDDYDGNAHVADGYTATADSALYNVRKDFTFSGTATAERTDAGTTNMGLKDSMFTNTNGNFANVTFVVTDGYVKINPIDVTVTITGHNNTTNYDGQAHTVTGYDVEIGNPLYKASDFTFTGTASASRTDAGTTNMGLAADQFVNNNGNFATVTFNVTDGYQTIDPIDVTVTIVGANVTVPYDGEAHTVTGYTATASTTLYDVENDIAFSGTASATRTDAGKTDMGLAAGQFSNTNGNFATVTFNVTDGYVTVTPIDVTVTIVGNNNTTVYDGEEHTVTGYVATASTDLYDVDADFTFTGEATASRTEEGTTQMGLEAGQFANTNNNFATVTFNVTDGYQTITPVDAVVVTITGATATDDYDGSAHTVTGYTATSNNPLYDVDSDFTFSGSATASRTDVGTTYMGLDESQFVNTNGNFATVTFVVTDGYQEITPIDVTVTIVGANATNDYDGSAHTVTGYTATADSDLYNVNTDFTFSGTDSATRTDAGKTMMGLEADQFVNTNGNFATVTFVVTDGYQEITPIDVTVTIVGANATNDYDGTEHTVTGYTATASTTLYDVDNDFTFSGNAEAKRTVVGTTYMGLAASQFANNNANFANVTFQVTDGYQTIEPITVTVTITENSDQVDYDGTEHTVTGYTVEISDPLYTEADFSFSGTASVSGVNAGSYDMTLTPDDFTNLSDNFENVTFVIEDGQLVIDPIDVTVTITEHSDTVSYDGTEHTVTGYDVSISNPLYTEADFTFSGNDSVSGTNAGSYDMGLTPDDFANTNPNFENVTFVIEDGQLVIDPIDVTVTIVGNNNTTDYDGQTHTVTGYVATASTDLYDVDADIAFTGEARAFRTDAGTTYMQLKAGQFSNTNPNFRTVTFNITDGYQEITPIDVTVTIVGNNNETDYDGEEHTVTGYVATASTDLYDVDADFTFSGNATASRTDVGTTNMGLEAGQFSNTNPNFRTVTFEVTDGYQTIDPIDVTVTITGHNNTTDYDGEEHTVTGYDVEISNPLYKEADFTFSGTASASRTDAGTTNMGLAGSQFANTNGNFRTVTFEVTDGYQTINPIDVTVTIVGNNNTTDYDGEIHTVTGYVATASTELYDVNADFTFKGKAQATRIDAGTAIMGLNAGQFTNTNANFRNVTFQVTDGYQTVNPIDVTVTIVGHNSIVTYDGEEHTVTGYDVEISDPLYTEADFTFSGNATATRTEVGTTDMGLAADQFANTNGNFATVTFDVTDGYQTINPLGQVVVTIVGNTLTVDYDGQPHTVTEYVVENISDPLYTVADFTFSGTASATRTDVGTTNMGLDASQFTNINDNFSDVTFNVTDGWVKVDPIDVTVTIVGNTSSVPYDGAVHTAEGFVATASTDLYDVNNDFTFSGTATAPRMYAGTTYMGLKAEQFANTNPNFATVTFNVTDGYQEITPIDITVTIVGNTDTVNYDGETHTVTGYEVTAISDPLFTEDMIIFSGDATVSGVDADTYYMGISAADFSEANDNFRNVTFNVTDGWLTIEPIDVVVTVVGNNDTVDYDGAEHTVTGYVATANTTLYDVAADFTFSGEATAKRTDAGTTMMGLAPEQFTNINNNFANVTFVVTDGYQKIDPIDVTVTIVGASNTSDYDGEAHTVTGYEATASTDLYDVTADFTFSGTATASRTDVGTTYMGLEDSQFVNTNPNFATVTFNVTDGYQTIGAIDVKVIITENGDQVDYDGQTHQVTGYTVDIQNPLYTEADFTFSGDASVSGVDAGNYDMQLNPGDFTNNNPNFANVTFEIVDGQLVIDPIDVTVTIVGNNNTTDYDGEAHTVNGYEATASTDLYDVTADFTFSGTATASRTDVGTTNMGLAADQFVNTNPNFATVTFNVTDGYQTIEAIDVEVTIVGATDTVTYDGQTHTVTGYTAEANTDLYDVTADFTFSGNDTASQLNVGTTYMGLAADQFANINPNFATVTFNVTDGYQTVTKRPVTLTSANGEKEYDGTVLKAEEVTVSGDKFVEGEGVSYSGFASITAPGTVDNTFTYTVLSGTDLDNYEITVVEGTLTVTGRKQPFVIEVTANSGEKMYDGTPLTVSGILSAVVESTGIATIGEDDAVTFTLNGATFTLTGLSAEETQTNVKRDGTAVGSYDVVVVGEHTVIDSEGNNVTSQFTVTTVNGELTITPRTVVLTSADDTKEYDGTALTNSTVTVGEDGFAQGEGAAYDVTGSQTLIGSSENAFTYTLNEGTLAGNYEISTVNGTLTVTLREDGEYDVVDKTYTLPDGKTEFALGDTVVFDITVTNIFDCEATVTLTEQAGVTWKDNGETVLTGIILAAGESKTFQAEYVITEADILAGEYTNTVKVEFTSELGTIGGEDDVTVPDIEDPNPELTLVKTTTSKPADGEKYDLGEIITYEIVAENTGNVTLTDVEVYDTMYGGASGEGTLMETFTVAKLAPGEKATFTFSYTVTEADLQTTLVNEATASAKNPSEKDTDVTEDSTEDVTADIVRELDVEKTLMNEHKEVYGLQTILNYEIVIRNLGNVTEYNVVLEDQMNGAYYPEKYFSFTNVATGEKVDFNTLVIPSIAPGEAVVIRAQHQTTAADESAVIWNTVFVNSDDITEPVTDESEKVTMQTLYGLHILYMDENWQIIAPGHYSRRAEGDQFSVKSPEVDGYTTTQLWVTDGGYGMPAEDVYIYVIYTKLPEETTEPSETTEPTEPEETTEPTEPTYDLTPLPEEEVPMGDVHLGDHTCCIMHFLIMLVAMILLACYTSDRKKYQKRIFEMKKALAAEEAGKTGMEENV